MPSTVGDGINTTVFIAEQWIVADETGETSVAPELPSFERHGLWRAKPPWRHEIKLTFQYIFYGQMPYNFCTIFSATPVEV